MLSTHVGLYVSLPFRFFY